jgi:uncharacterized protein (DUF1800 family)
VQVEAFNLRQADAAERNERQRKLRPPLNEIVTQQEMATLLGGGNVEEKTAIINGLDPEKRKQLMRAIPFAVPEPFRREAITLGQPQQLPFIELTDAKLYRGLYSTHQLEEILVDFWVNHFNVFSGKGPVRTMLTSYERDAIRPYVLGHFRDMLLATARHPAMQFYLDNWQSQVSDGSIPPATGTPQQHPGLNENYGREIMELHTLGVDGGYTQADVVNVARAFTGWTIHEPNKYAEFFFNPAMHDRGEKVVLGHTIPRGGGEDDGIRVIDILSRHPSTAHFISQKLAQRFVADAPPASLVNRMAATFIRTDGDLRAVMETMLLSPEFMSEGAWRSKIKSPLELVLSAMRGLNADVTDTMAVAQRLADLGQPLYAKLEPTGYPNVSAGWVSSASLLARMNLVTALTAKQIGGVAIDTRAFPASQPRRAARQLFGTSPSTSLLAALARTPSDRLSSASLITVLVGSPDFQQR